MPKGYGQYCPLALATELLGERWSILVLSRLLDGCAHFNDIHRGLPRIPASTLSARLHTFEDGGLVTRQTGPGTRSTYQLTEAGRALEPVVDYLVAWGQEWARDMRTDDLDPRFLAWSIHLRVDTESMPTGRTVIEFEFSGAPADGRFFWLVCDQGAVDMCFKHPGFTTDLKVTSDLRRFVEAWRGFRSLEAEIRAGQIKLHGPRRLRQAFPDWMLLSMAAPNERKRPGHEQALWRARPGSRPT